MLENKTKKVPFRLTPERHKELKKLLADREQTFQDVLEEGLRLLLSDSAERKESISKNTEIQAPHPAYNDLEPQIHKLVDMLVEVLRSGHVAAITAVKSNLIAFKQLVDLESRTGGGAESASGDAIPRSPRGQIEEAVRHAQSLKNYPPASGEQRHPGKGDH